LVGETEKLLQDSLNNLCLFQFDDCKDLTNKGLNGVERWKQNWTM